METIGGYRIIRKLGSGGRSDIYLGHAGLGHASSVPAAPTGGREAGLAAIKVFKVGVPATSIDGEISALSRLQHAHIVRLLDLATGPADTPCLVLQRLATGGLSALLAERRVLQAGEAVTILAPVVAAVGAMHRDGVVHGQLAASAIHSDDSGSPMIIGFGSAVCFAVPGVATSEAELDAEPRVQADLRSLLALVGSVMARSSHTEPSVNEFTGWLGEQQGGRVDLTELEHRLFGMANPVAVQFTEPATSVRDNEVPSRLGSPHGYADQRSPARLSESTSSSAPAKFTGRKADLLSALPPEIATWVANRLAIAPQGLFARVPALLAQLRLVRRRVWMIAAVGLVAVVTAAAITGLPGQDNAVVATPHTTEPPTPVTSSVTNGDDPVAAAGELLRIRAGCVADRSILCLDAVHAPDSAAWQADASRIRGVEDGAELGPDPFQPESSVTVVDRLGQTALLTVTHDGATPTNTTASVLMIRTEAGWRFRSLLADSVPLDGELP